MTEPRGLRDPGGAVVHEQSREGVPPVAEPSEVSVTPTGTDPTAEELDRIAELKEALLFYAQSGPCSRQLKAFFREYLRVDDGLDLLKGAVILGEFVLGYRWPNGSTVISRFLASRRDLDETDRLVVSGWGQDSFLGVFEITRMIDNGVVGHNLVDDLEYRIFDTACQEWVIHVELGGFLRTRVTPIASHPGCWMSFDPVQAMAPDSSHEVATEVAGLVMRYPQFVFRNPEYAKEGWASQAEQRQVFIETFGSDEVVLPIGEADDRMRQFYANAGTGSSAAIPMLSANGVADGGQGTHPWRARLAKEVPGAETLGVLYDETDGLTYVPDLAKLRALFADPALAQVPEYLGLLDDLLHDARFPPVIFRRLADLYPGTADAVWRAALDAPSFTWLSDGEALLSTHRPEYFATPAQPRTTTLPKRMLELLRST
jgi:hypothetical protein